MRFADTLDLKETGLEGPRTSYLVPRYSVLGTVVPSLEARPTFCKFVNSTLVTLSLKIMSLRILDAVMQCEEARENAGVWTLGRSHESAHDLEASQATELVIQCPVKAEVPSEIRIRILLLVIKLKDAEVA